MVQALLAHGAHPAFGHSIRIGSPVRGEDSLDALGREYGVEARGERGVPVMDEEARWHDPILNLPAKLTRLLCHPGRRRVACTARQMDPPRPQFAKEEDIHGVREGRLDREEIARHHEIAMAPEKGAPCAALLSAAWAWRNAMTFEHIPHRGTTDGVGEFAQLAMDLAIAPTRILADQVQDQGLDLGVDPGPPAVTPALERPLVADEITVPTQDRFWLDEDDAAAETGACVRHMVPEMARSCDQRRLLPPRDPR